MSTAHEIEMRLAEYMSKMEKNQHDIITAMADYASLGMYRIFVLPPIMDALCSPWGRPMPEIMDTIKIAPCPWWLTHA